MATVSLHLVRMHARRAGCALLLVATLRALSQQQAAATFARQIRCARGLWSKTCPSTTSRPPAILSPQRNQAQAMTGRCKIKALPAVLAGTTGKRETNATKRAGAAHRRRRRHRHRHRHHRRRRHHWVSLILDRDTAWTPMATGRSATFAMIPLWAPPATSPPRAAKRSADQIQGAQASCFKTCRCTAPHRLATW